MAIKATNVPKKRTVNKDTLSLRKLVDNPSGKGSSYLYSRSKIKEQLNSEFVYILSRFRKYFKVSIIGWPDGRLTYHVKVPSSDYNHNKLLYDVIIEIPNDKTKRPALRDAKWWSNCPSFVFTYAYVFYHSDLMIDRYSNLLPSQCLTQYPSVRNPVASLGYERSLYFAARFLMDSNALSGTFIRRTMTKAYPAIDYNFRSTITPLDTILAIYQHSKDLQVKNHRKPVDQRRRAEREKIKREYIEKRKEDKRSKYLKERKTNLTARKFKRIIGKK